MTNNNYLKYTIEMFGHDLQAAMLRIPRWIIESKSNRASKSNENNNGYAANTDGIDFVEQRKRYWGKFELAVCLCRQANLVHFVL